ncbi:RAD51-associated protein 2-like isoform X2 [Phyllopteryx taeniolatus]|uniref:RAD51-associated protein 2-like isoform X2 n=1 Tax=Phyllopteryx taeniolatus TaxID=161469 RepID=UPI002AD4F3F0|nr:RAD51-associated protein 2-like isoform X2 [Phyllopteryx taeniolatus]
MLTSCLVVGSWVNGQAGLTVGCGEFTCDDGTPPEQCGEVLCNEVSKSKCYLSSPELALHRDRTLDPEACRITSREGEQEVPIGCHMSSKPSCLVAEKHKEPQQTELKRRAWSPSFRCLPLMQPQNDTPLWEAKRLEPLRTCTRPIRLGLSKKAKPKSLHRFQPYK